jgi:hypothetical protein
MCAIRRPEIPEADKGTIPFRGGNVYYLCAVELQHCVSSRICFILQG